MSNDIDTKDIAFLMQIIENIAGKQKLPFEVEDFIQDTLERLLRRDLPRYVKLAWLTLYIKHRIVDAWRYHQRHYEISIDTAEFEYHAIASTPDKTFEHAQAQELQPIAQAALAGLSPDHRRTIMLRACGYSYRSIADITGTKLGTVRSRLFHARLRLAPLLVADAS